jgi:hypothetical protein
VLAAVCRRLPPSDAAAHVTRTVDYILEARAGTKEKDKSNYSFQARALGALCGRLDAARASRAAGAIIAILGDRETVGEAKHEFIARGYIASVLTELAGRLDAPGGLRAAEDLVLVLRRSSANVSFALEEPRAALVAVCRRLDAVGAARVAEAVVAAVRDPKTAALVRAIFADAPAVLAGRLTPDQTASLESALVDSIVADLADAKPRERRGVLGQALAAACGRPGKNAARAAEALVAAIRDPQTPLITLKPLAEALAAVLGRLPPRDAAPHANHAVDALNSLWAARTALTNRAVLTQALAAVWARLDPADAAARARRVAADLEGELRDSKTAPNRFSREARALSVVYNHLDPAERSGRANAVADTLVAGLRRFRTNPAMIDQLWDALAALCGHLDRPADALLPVMDDPTVQQGPASVYETMFQKVAARLRERDLQRLLEHPLVAGRLQRILLDVLAGSKKRSFRNTWDYLDATDRHTEGN